MHEEWLNMASSYAQAKVQGQDPIRAVTPEARNVSVEVAQSFMIPEMAVRGVMRDEIFKVSKDHPAVKLYNTYAEKLDLRKKSAMREVKFGMSPMEMREVIANYERVPIDEAHEQAILDFLNEVDGEVRQEDESFSVSDDPLYAKMLESFSRAGDIEATTPGEAEGTSAVGRTARQFATLTTEGLGELYGQVSDGFVELGFMMLGGIDSNYYKAWRETKGPDKFLIDKEGNILNNGGKIGRGEVPYLLFQLMTGMAVGDIEKEAQKYRDIVDWDRAQVREGAERYANITASVAAGLTTFVGTGGGALISTASKLMNKGSVALLAGRGVRTQALGRLAFELGGIGVGTGIWEMGMYGNVEGYGHAFGEGMKMAPVFWVMGKIGRNAERMMATRTKMPRAARNFTTGILEGATLSASEAADLTSSLWNFMRNPDDEQVRATWLQGLVGNMLSVGLFKAATGRTPFEVRQMTELLGAEGARGAMAQEAEGRQRRTAASKAKDQGDVESAAQKFGARRETFRTYTEKTQAFERATGEEQQKIGEEVTKTERRLDTERAGKDLTQAERLEANLEIRRRMEEEPEGSDPLEDPTIRDQLTPEQFQEMASKKGARARRQKMEEFLGKEDRRGTKGETVPEYKKDPTDPTKGVELTKRERDRRREKKEAEGEEELFKSDPLEDPSILRKLSPEEFQDVASGKTAELRRRLLEKYLGKADRRGLKQEILPIYRKDPVTNEIRMIRPGGERRIAGERRGRVVAEPEKKAHPAEEEEELRFTRISETGEEIPDPRAGQPKSMRLQPELQVEAVEGAKDIRKKDIKLLMQGLPGDPVQVSMRKGIAIKGRTSTKGMMGWYERWGNQIRTREARDIVTDSHEWSHAFEEEATKAKQWSQKMAEPWLEDFAKVAETYPGYDKLSKRDRVAEGFAEFWAREMLGDPALQPEVPELHEFMMDWISRPEMFAFRRQHDAIQKGILNYFNIGALRRVRMSWIPAGEKPSDIEKMAAPTKWQRTKSAFSKYMLDDVAPIKEAEAEQFKQAGIDPETVPMAFSPTKLIDTFRMTATNQAQRMMNEGTFDVTGKKTGEGLEQIKKDIGYEKLADFTDYIVSRRAVDQINRSNKLVAEGKLSAPFEMPLAKADYLETIRVLETPEFRAGAQRIRDWATRILDHMVEAGAISEGERDAMIESNPVWVPFQRVLEGARRVKAGRGIAEKGSGIGRFRGAQEEIRDPWEAMRDVTIGMVTKAQQSMVMRAMYLQGQVMPGVAGFVTEVPRAKRPQKIMLERLQEELKRLGKKRNVPKEAREGLEQMIELVAGGSEDAALTFFFQQTTPTGSRPIIAFKPNFTEKFLDELPISEKKKADLLARSGKLIWLEVHPEAYSVLMGIDAPRLFLDNAPSMLRNMIMLPTRMVRFGATSYNPEFIVRNVGRDIGTRQQQTTEGSNVAGPLSGMAAMFQGAASQIKGTETAQLFENMGLSGATLFGTEMGRELAGSPHDVVKGIRKVGEWFSAPEKWLRVKEFTDVRDRLLKEGASEFEAIMQASLASKEVTVNFTRAGVLARQMNQFLPYFSAQIAGKRKFWRLLSGAEGKAMQRQSIIRGMINLGGMSAATWFFFGDEDWYQDLPEYKRITAWNFKIGDQIISIPKPFEAGILFGTGTELFLQGLHDADPELARETAFTFFGDHLVGYPWIPAGILPFVEGTADYSFFREQSILPKYMSTTRMPKDQYTAYTSEMFKMLGGAFNISPAKLEYVFDQYTGGILRQAARLGESLAGLRDAEPTLSKLPFVGTIFRQAEHGQSRAVDKLYDTDALMRRMAGSGDLDREGLRLQKKVRAAITKIRNLRKNSKLSREEFNQRAFRIADPVVQEIRRKL